MVFNWFRRQFEQSPEDLKTQPEGAVQPSGQEVGVSPQAPEAPAIATPDPEAAPGTEDYLAWAKAAYQNLKKQQTAEAEQPAPEPIPESIPDSTPDSTPGSIPEPVSESETRPTSEDALQESLPPSTSPTQTEVPLESSVTDEPERSDASPDVSSPDSGAVSFLQRAEAARQSRLEQLKATAIEDPTPASPSTQTSAPAAPTDLESRSRLSFDEDFLWSAEVLAAEGRQPEQVSIEEIDWLKQLRQGLGKTRRNLLNQLKSIVGQGPLNAEAVMEIEALLLQADVGVEATDTVIGALQQKLLEEALPSEEAIAYLKTILRDMLDRPLAQAASPILAPEHDKLNIWLMTGVNGAGKTTTIGKLAHLGQKSGYRCLIAAGDTFRAAAVQQVQAWGDRTGVEVIANPGQNTDPAAVVYDAIAAAKARKAELLLVDTAGRLQNKKNLMAELSKIRRVIDKNAEDALVESLLVLDASLGQNGVRQAELFSEAATLTGVVLTKLDGSARGGVALAIVQQLGLPIRFVGAGEGMADLRPFSSHEFVEALLSG